MQRTATCGVGLCAGPPLPYLPRYVGAKRQLRGVTVGARMHELPRGTAFGGRARPLLLPNRQARCVTVCSGDTSPELSGWEWRWVDFDDEIDAVKEWYEKSFTSRKRIVKTLLWMLKTFVVLFLKYFLWYQVANIFSLAFWKYSTLMVMENPVPWN